MTGTHAINDTFESFRWDEVPRGVQADSSVREFGQILNLHIIQDDEAILDLVKLNQLEQGLNSVPGSKEFSSRSFGTVPNCDFENDLCSWNIEGRSAFQWNQTSGIDVLKSEFDGPQSDFDSNENGHFLLAYASNEKGQRATTKVVSPILEGVQCFTFYFVVSIGNDIDSLSIFIDSMGHKSPSLIWQLKDHKHQMWEKGQVKITNAEEYQVWIEASRPGTSEGFVAVDQFEFSEDLDNCQLIPDIASVSKSVQKPEEGNCEFENGVCTWILFGGDFAWERMNVEDLAHGELQGPETDHAGGTNGYFLYATQRSSENDKDVATFESSMFENVPQQCFHFVFNMPEGGISALILATEDAQGYREQIWKHNGLPITQWETGRVLITRDYDYTIVISVIHGNGKDGYVSIDDVRFSLLDLEECSLVPEDAIPETPTTPAPQTEHPPHVTSCTFEKDFCDWKPNGGKWNRLSGNEIQANEEIHGPDVDFDESPVEKFLVVDVAESLAAGVKRGNIVRLMNGLNEDVECMHFWYKLELKIGYFLGQGQKGYIAIDNIDLTITDTCAFIPEEAYPFPDPDYQCDFESGWCEWFAEGPDEFRFNLVKGEMISNPSYYHLPDKDHTGSAVAQYLGLEFHEQKNQRPDQDQSRGLETTLRGLTLDGKKHNFACFRFWYSHNIESQFTITLETRRLSDFRRDFVWILHQPKRNTRNTWMQGQARLRSFDQGEYEVIFKIQPNGERAGYFALDDFSLSHTDHCLINPLEALPVDQPRPVCTFEENLCYWKPYPGDDKFHFRRTDGNSVVAEGISGPQTDLNGDPEGFFVIADGSTGKFLELAALESPQYNGTITEKECFHFWYWFEDKEHIELVDIEILKEGIVAPELIWRQGDVGEQGDEKTWLEGQVDVIPDGAISYKITFSVVKGRNNFGTFAVDEFHFNAKEECPTIPKRAEIPAFFCEFELNLCGWEVKAHEDRFTFNRMTSEQIEEQGLMGPSGDFFNQKNKKFLFVDAEEGGNAGIIAVLESPKISGDKVGQCFKFVYALENSNGEHGIKSITIQSVTTILEEESVIVLWTLSDESELQKDKDSNVWVKGQTKLRSFLKKDFKADDLCGWEDSGPAEFSFVRVNGQMVSEYESDSRLPKEDHLQSDSGYYMGLERIVAKRSILGGETAIFTSPEYIYGDMPKGCIRFWYSHDRDNRLNIQLQRVNAEENVQHLWQLFNPTRSEGDPIWMQGQVLFHSHEEVNYRIQLEVKPDEEEDMGYFAFDDISISTQDDCPLVPDFALPVGVVDCDFEGGTCDWEIGHLGGDFQWHRSDVHEIQFNGQQGPMNSLSGDSFLIVQAENNGNEGDKTKLTSPIFKAESNPRLCLQFWFWIEHQGGIQSFKVNKDSEIEQSKELWTLFGEDTTEPIWNEGQVEIIPDAESIYLAVFEVIKGDTDNGFVALDNVAIISKEECPNIPAGASPPTPSPSDVIECSFDNGDLCSWGSSGADDSFNWIATNGNDQGAMENPGPSVDHLNDAQNGFMLAKQSAETENESSTQLESPLLTAGEKEYCLSFWFVIKLAFLATGIGAHNGYVGIDDISYHETTDICDIQPPEAKPSVTCSETEIKCGNQECVPLDALCDFHSDCSDNLDEVECPYLFDFETCAKETGQPICHWYQLEDIEILAWNIIPGNSSETSINGPHDTYSNILFLSHNETAEIGVEDANPELFSPEYRNSGITCKIEYHYFMHGDFGGKDVAFKPTLQKGDESSTVLDHHFAHDTEEWITAEVGIGRQTGQFKLIFDKDSSDVFNGTIAISSVSLLNCERPIAKDSCTNEEFRCKNKGCVLKQERCDMSDNCGDNSDEAGGCPGYHFNDFEADMGMFSDLDQESDFKWQLGQSTTDNRGTGPPFDHTTFGPEGRYLFINSSNEMAPNLAASIISVPFDKVRNVDQKCRVRFYFHMYGQDVGTLSLKVKPDNTPDESLSLWSTSSSKGNAWVKEDQPIEITDQGFQVIFEAKVTKLGTGDIAVDDISFTPECLVMGESTIPPTTTTSTTPTTKAPCSGDQFHCGGGTCVASAKVCDFVDDCPNAEDEATCPNLFTFNECPMLSDCGWTNDVEDALDFIAVSIKDLIDGGETSHGPNLDMNNSTEGHIVFLLNDGDVEDYSTTTAKMTGPTYENANAKCLLEFWYYLNGNTGENMALIPALKHVDLGKSTFLDYLIVDGNLESAKTWHYAVIGLGRQRGKFQISFIQQTGKTFDASVALDDVKFTDCNIPPGLPDGECPPEDSELNPNQPQFHDDCGDGSDEDRPYCAQNIVTNFEDETFGYFFLDQASIQSGEHFKLGQGITNGRGSGPPFDHTRLDPNGVYAYMDSTALANGTHTYLYSFPFKGSYQRETKICPMTIWFFLKGNRQGFVRIYKETVGSTLETLFEAKSSGISAWTRAKVNIEYQAGQIYRFVIEGELYDGDIGLDDIVFHDDFAPPVTVKPDLPPGDGLSTGAIVAIVIVPIILIVLIAGAIVFSYKRKDTRPNKMDGDTITMSNLTDIHN
eukprot:TCALIF_02944-PA protein Name:"Similar to MALRD1 MAM and LDL-receptor class A domain-containing protein 1 (Homo sapiens)" AED:0.07 eAED:0.07 QI:0/0.76/0.71/0.94/0.84/0.87/39/446/2521